MTETQVAVIIERLDHVIRRIDDLDDSHEQKLDRIEAQAKQTNGRVTALEKWKSYVLGGVAMATFIIGIVMPVLMLILRKYF